MNPNQDDSLSSGAIPPGTPRCCKCGEPVDVISGVYDDGEWLCGHCIAGYADAADRKDD